MNWKMKKNWWNGQLPAMKRHWKLPGRIRNLMTSKSFETVFTGQEEPV